MTQLLTQPVRPGLLTLRMMLGAGIASIPIILFLLDTEGDNQQWGMLWILRPLIIVSFAGAAGAAFYHFMSPLRSRPGTGKIVVTILCAIVYMVGVFLGISLGLDGTYWD